MLRLTTIEYRCHECGIARTVAREKSELRLALKSEIPFLVRFRECEHARELTAYECEQLTKFLARGDYSL